MFGDKAVFDFIYSFSHRSSILDGLFIFLANYLIYFIVGLFLFYLLFRVSDKRRKISLFLFGALALIISRGIITEVVRFFYDRPRPFNDGTLQALINHSASFSFPSGHMAFLTPLVLLSFSLNKRLGIFLGILTLLVGFGRIAAGVHFPSDIFGGVAVGILGFYLTRLFLREAKS